MALTGDSLTFSYPCGKVLLRDFSIEVAPGERVAVTGPSGRGKTTLCRLLAGHLAPSAGRVLVDGRELPARGVRPVQLIGQHPEQAFDPLLRIWHSVGEAAGSGCRRREWVEDALGKVDLLDALAIRDEWLDRYPHELSGGELARLSMARALLAHPRYLVCDEMTAMLDAVTQADIWREVMRIADERGMGLLVVSHSPALLDRVATRRVAL